MRPAYPSCRVDQRIHHAPFCREGLHSFNPEPTATELSAFVIGAGSNEPSLAAAIPDLSPQWRPIGAGSGSNVATHAPRAVRIPQRGEMRAAPRFCSAGTHHAPRRNLLAGNNLRRRSLFGCLPHLWQHWHTSPCGWSSGFSRQTEARCRETRQLHECSTGATDETRTEHGRQSVFGLCSIRGSFLSLPSIIIFLFLMFLSKVQSGGQPRTKQRAFFARRCPRLRVLPQVGRIMPRRRNSLLRNELCIDIRYRL